MLSDVLEADLTLDLRTPKIFSEPRAWEPANIAIFKNGAQVGNQQVSLPSKGRADCH